MKAQQIEVGKVYIARVSGQLANVRVDRMEEASNGRHRWVCHNLGTGRKVVVKGAARFRREAVPMLSGEEKQRTERGIEVAARLKRRRSLAEAINSHPTCPRCGGVRGFGMAGCPACHEDRQEGTLPEAPLGRDDLVEQFRQVVAPARADNKIYPVDTNSERTNSMHIAEADARSLLRALGNKNADTLTVPELEHRLNQPKKLAKHMEGRDLEQSHIDLLKSIADATDEGERVVAVAETQEQEEMVEKGGTEETQSEEQSVKAHANGRAKAGKKTKPGKPAAAKRQDTRTGPSMVGRVIELLRKAGPKHPATKEHIVGTLLEEFPGHKEDTVRQSVSWYLSTMKKKKGLDVERNASGYWMAKA